MQISLCSGQKCNQMACRRKLNKPCLSFYYLAVSFLRFRSCGDTERVAPGIPVALTEAVLGPGSILTPQKGLNSLHLCLCQKALNMHLIKIVVRVMKCLWGKFAWNYEYMYMLSFWNGFRAEILTKELVKEQEMVQKTMTVNSLGGK